MKRSAGGATVIRRPKTSLCPSGSVAIEIGGAGERFYKPISHPSKIGPPYGAGKSTGGSPENCITRILEGYTEDCHLRHRRRLAKRFWLIC